MTEPQATAAEVLRAARAHINDKGRWTRGANARNADGLPVPPWDRRAVCWCARGAVIRESGGYAMRWRALILLSRASYAGSVDSTNDHSSHQAVLRMFDRAIKLAENRS